MSDDTVELKPPEESTAARRALYLGTLVIRAEFGLMLQNVPNKAVSAFRDQTILPMDSWLKSEGLLSHLSQTEKALFGKPIDSWSPQDFADAIWRTESLGVLLWSLSVVDRQPPFDDLTFSQIIEMVAKDALAKGEIPRMIKGDFPTLGKAYANLSGEEYPKIASIAQERHFALNWLCGYSEDWDLTPKLRKPTGSEIDTGNTGPATVKTSRQDDQRPDHTEQRHLQLQRRDGEDLQRY